jgi:hypothetical protein
MIRTFWLCCLTFAIGVIIVALPDSGARVFTITERHGPAWIDIIGLTLVMIPWVYMIIYSIVKWRRVLYTLGRRVATIAIGVALTGLVVIGVSLSRDTDSWMLGSAMALAGESAWIIAAFRKK